MTTQDVFFPIIAAIAGFSFGGMIGGALPYGLIRPDPTDRNYSNDRFVRDMTSFLCGLAGFVVGSILYFCLYYIGVPLTYLLSVGFTVSALSSLFCPETVRWSIIKSIWNFLIFLFVPIVSLIGLYLLYVSQPFPGQ